MNANNMKSGVMGALFVGAIAMVLPFSAVAEQGLDASSQTKVNKAKAKGWATSDGKKSGYDVQSDKTLVNFGSKKAGTCGVNVGTVKPGEKAPKDIVVTTKDVINICK